VLFAGGATLIRLQSLFLNILGSENKAILEHLLSGIGAPCTVVLIMYLIYLGANVIGPCFRRNKGKWKFQRKLRILILRTPLIKFGKFRLDPPVIVYSAFGIYILGAIFWELYYQPLVEVHAGKSDPRGHVQLGQYMADLIGAYIFLWINSVAPRYSPKAAVQR